ncbi:MAG TPA: VWA domain-containing protein [Bryobacteraceae bacterium]|jgi:VWFA-related protein|nr:VWA domain-containing protein [Bryobacteraceae bacterium]
MRTLTLLPPALLWLSGAIAQTQSGETFKTGVTVIQVPVVVRDHDGQVVSNLGKDDFQLFDNGKRQEITSFSVEDPGVVAPDRSLPEGNASKAQTAAGNGIDIPTRFIAYLFDDVTIRDFGDLKHIRDAATAQLGALRPGDRAAIFTTSCRVNLDFTNDPVKLQDALSHLEFRPPPVCRVSRVQVLQVEILKAVVSKMSSLPGRRDIILISSGFFIGPQRSFEETDLMEGAIRAKVSINSVDAGEATDYAGGGAASGMADTQPPRYDNPANAIVLEDLAHGTGGRYVTGNDFALSFRKLSTPESHYLLGFVPAAKADGRFHQLKVKLENAHKMTVEARSGYYAGL